MPDPLAIAALGAAVGGTAGKIVGKAWDSGERWLRERFGTHSHEVQEQAHLNAAHFLEELATRIKKLEDERARTPDTMLKAERHPAFSALLQRSLLNASQTDDAQKQTLLAHLVATRLAAEAESTLALVSQLASDAILHSTRRQLKIMALLCFLEDIRPRDPVSVDGYGYWVQVHLQPFSNFEYQEIDARHLVAINCATYDPTSERDLEILLQMKGGTHCIGATLIEDVPGVHELQFHWNEGLAGVSLTSVGSLVGGLAYEQITGMDIGPPAWAHHNSIGNE